MEWSKKILIFSYLMLGDIMGANFYHVVQMMKDRLKCNAVPIQLWNALSSFSFIFSIPFLINLCRTSVRCFSNLIPRNGCWARLVTSANISRLLEIKLRNWEFPPSYLGINQGNEDFSV